MNSDKTLILMDTNKTRSLFHGSPRYDNFDLGAEFKDLKTFIDENNLSENVILGITEMTLKELLIQKKKVYETDKENLISASSRLRNLENTSIPDFTLPDDSFDCIDYLNPKVEAFLHDKNILLIKIGEGKKETILDTLIQKAINGKRPYGFKDAIILETFNQSEIKNDYVNVILFTGDNGFDGCDEEITDVNFKIIKSKEVVIKELETIYAENLLEKKYEDLSKNQYLVTNLKQMIASELDSDLTDVDIVSLTEKIIDEPVELKQKFPSLNQEDEYFVNMVCFVSQVRINDSKYVINSLIDLGSNEIETIQVEAI